MITVTGGTLYQWDLDRRIKVLNPKITKIAFANNHYCDCDRIDVVDGMVTIPNKFLQSYQDISVYGVDAAGKEIYSCELSVNPRLKPENYSGYDGEAGQFAVSNGKGGFNWVTVEVASEVTF